MQRLTHLQTLDASTDRRDTSPAPSDPSTYGNSERAEHLGVAALAFEGIPLTDADNLQPHRHLTVGDNRHRHGVRSKLVWVAEPIDHHRLHRLHAHPVSTERSDETIDPPPTTTPPWECADGPHVECPESRPVVRSASRRLRQRESTMMSGVSTRGSGVIPIEGAVMRRAVPDDAPEVLVLQRCCWVDEAIANETLDIAALHESLEDVRAWLNDWTTSCVRVAGRLVGAVRARREGSSWEIGRLMVAPDLAGQGLGRWLLRLAEEQAPADVESITLFTGAQSTRNIAMYERAGFVRAALPAPPGAIRLAKRLDPDREVSVAEARDWR